MNGFRSISHKNKHHDQFDSFFVKKKKSIEKHYIGLP